NTPAGDVRLSGQQLRLDGIIKDVCFDLCDVELLGIAGLMGSGRTNVAETLFGITPSDSCEVRFDGKTVHIGDPHQAIELGFALRTEDRKLTGLFPCLSVMENLEMAVLANHAGNGFVQQKALRALCEAMCNKLRGKTPSLAQCVPTSSGGHHQNAPAPHPLSDIPC
ncbi:sugar ABC transporter ATP-binding protein, partial [Pseudomonas syringae]